MIIKLYNFICLILKKKKWKRFRLSRDKASQKKKTGIYFHYSRQFTWMISIRFTRSFLYHFALPFKPSEVKVLLIIIKLDDHIKNAMTWSEVKCLNIFSEESHRTGYSTTFNSSSRLISIPVEDGSGSNGTLNPGKPANMNLLRTDQLVCCCYSSCLESIWKNISVSNYRHN